MLLMITKVTVVRNEVISNVFYISVMIIYSKANRMLGLISRTMKYRNPEVLLNLYKSMVRPHLEYCSTVWSPHYIKDKMLLERVQHRFTRLFPHLSLVKEETGLI